MRCDYDAETSFVYDGRLNLTKRIEGTGAGTLETTFEYDAYDRLTTATLPTGWVKAFTYGPLSRRLARKDVDGSVETHFYGPGWETYPPSPFRLRRGK